LTRRRKQNWQKRPFSVTHPELVLTRWDIWSHVVHCLELRRLASELLRRQQCYPTLCLLHNSIVV